MNYEDLFLEGYYDAINEMEDSYDEEDLEEAYLEGYYAALNEANKYEKYMGMTNDQKKKARRNRNFDNNETTRHVTLKNGKNATIRKTSGFKYHNFGGSRKIATDNSSNSYTVAKKGYFVAPESREKNLSSTYSRNLRRDRGSIRWHNIDK